jgi:hypothetical protein
MNGNQQTICLIEKTVIFFIGGRLAVNKILHVTNRDVRKMITIAER